VLPKTLTPSLALLKSRSRFPRFTAFGLSRKPAELIRMTTHFGGGDGGFSTEPERLFIAALLDEDEKQAIGVTAR
jgi:hypothetical protein